jgi:hypothetical protein
MHTQIFNSAYRFLFQILGFFKHWQKVSFPLNCMITLYVAIHSAVWYSCENFEFKVLNICHNWNLLWLLLLGYNCLKNVNILEN